MSDNKPKNISATEAWELIQKAARTVFIDVRSEMEFLFIGHPKGAKHIAWIDEPDWNINPNFVREVRKLILGGVISSSASDSVPIVLICRSGKRSEEAGIVLMEAGFNDVYNVAEGFEGDLDDDHHRSTTGGWRHDNLPWEQC